MENICRICLRLDKELRVVSNVLSEYHDELCDYKMDTLDPQYCNECRYLLKKMYKFKEKCILAFKILQEWKQKNLDEKKLKDLHTLLPKTSLGMWIENDAKNATFSYTETERVPVLCIDRGFIKTSAVNQKQATETPPIKAGQRNLVLMKKDDFIRNFVYIKAATSEGVNIKQNNENSNKANFELQTNNKTKTTNNTKEKLNEEKAKNSKEIKSSNDNIRDIDYSVMECNDSDGACSIKSIDVSNDHSYTTTEKGSFYESKKIKVKMNKTRKRSKRKPMKFDKKNLEVVAKSVPGKLVKSIDLQTLKQECDLKSKATFCVERLKAELMLKFAALDSNLMFDGEIDGYFLIKCLDTKVKEATLNRLWSYVRRGHLFSEPCLNLLRTIQRSLKNDLQYESIFEIEYLNTEEKMREEFEKRKTYEGYLNAEFKCEICYQGFKYPTAFEKHKALHDESSGDHACSICMIRYKQRGSLIDHKNVSHSNVYKCKMCRMITYYRYCMINHYEQHLGKKYSCIPCGLTYKSRSAYLSHVSTNHYAPEHLCIACGRAFRTAVSLKHHKKRKHGGDLENLSIGGSDARCEQCDVTFPSPEVYIQHLRAAHKELRRNSQDEKPRGLRNVPVMNCRVCDATGSSYGWLVQHFNTVHPDVDMDLLYADKKPHLCHICGKRLSNSHSLSEHINVHLNVQRHQCKTCGKWFRRQSLLYFHRLMHQPPSLVCSQCGKTFRSPSNLRAHMRGHIGNRRYKCRICGKGFLHQATLNEHVRGVHHHIRRVKNKQKPTAKTINKAEEYIHSSPQTGAKSDATEEDVAEVKVVYMVGAVEEGSEAIEESSEVVEEGSEAVEEGNEVVEECNVEAMEVKRTEAQKSKGKATKQSNKKEESNNADETQVEYYEDVLEEGWDETPEECSAEEKNNNCYEIQEDYYEEVLEEGYDETTEQCIAEAKNRNTDETQEGLEEVLEECLEEFLEEDLYDEET